MRVQVQSTRNVAVISASACVRVRVCVCGVILEGGDPFERPSVQACPIDSR
jgi:hypothetical protein